MTIYVTSDTHFFHRKICEYSERPFASTGEMDRALIARWNARVEADDLVYHLGDFAFGPRGWLLPLRAVLRGRIVLVRGNHDRSRAAYQEAGFQDVADALDLEHRGLKLHLVHKPPSDEALYALHDASYDAVLHGHVHKSWSRRDDSWLPRINVGVDVRDYEPKTLDEILTSGT